MTGAQEPRICVIPDGDEHPRWAEVLELLDRLGIKLDPWQLAVLHASLLRRNGLWAAFTVAVCCPRQNGKNEILQARELVGALLLGEALIIHSAHLADTCMEAFIRLDDLIDSNDWLADQVEYVRRTNGRELIKFHNGSRLRFRTRTRGGGRGFSGSPVIFDEPMFFPVISQNAILPVLSAQPDPQAWYTGSAVDQTEHADGIVFARVRERALSGEDPRLLYMEWSLDADNPEVVTEKQALDVESWAMTNPALGIRITPEYIRAEHEELLPRGFAVERLGVGDWPDTSGIADMVLDPVAWESGGHDNTIVGDRCVAFDVSPERMTSVVAVGLNDEGAFAIEVLKTSPGTGWVADYLRELDEAGDVVEFACDGYGPAGSVAKAADELLGISIRRLDANEYAQACELLCDYVAEGAVRHGNDAGLDAAVRAGRTRPLVDRWAWSRRNSRADISPLVAATLGIWSAVDRDIANREELMIF